MKVLVSVASFGLVPVPSVSILRGQLYLGVTSCQAASTRCDGDVMAERLATQDEVAELDLQLRQAQPEIKRQHA